MRVFSQEHKRKLSESKKKQGIVPPSRIGIKHTKEARKKISVGNKGKKLSNKTKLKMSEIRKKNPVTYWSGKKRTFNNEWLENIRKANKKRIGTKLSDKHKRNISLGNGGTGIPQRTSERYYHLIDWKYKDWRTKVFERDNWTCQFCGIVGAKLNPHHIKGWAKYEKLRYDVENGVTLCVECHRLAHKKH